MPTNTKPSIVFAHGLWADGSCFSKLIPTLLAEGHEVMASQHGLDSLATDVAAVKACLARVRTPAILVGHSYGGTLITHAGIDPRVAGLVYIAALAPDEGETVADVFYRAEPHPKAPKLVPDNHGLIWLPEDAFAAAFAQNATAEEQALLAAVQRPIAVPCINVEVGRPLWLDRPSWFLLAEADHMIVPGTQRFMAERMKAEVRSYPVDHTPSVTAPNAVVDIVLDALRNTAPAK